MSPDPRKLAPPVLIGVLALAVLFLSLKSWQTVPAGHVAVATLFGEVQPEPYPEGWHFPARPGVSRRLGWIGVVA